MKIMIVEDDTGLREELKEFLERNGYEVFVVTRFDHVVETVLEVNPHLLILDLNLPFNDGHRICRKLRKISKIPILFVTVQNTEVDELLSMELGADDFVTKPYNTRILLARIQAILKRSYPQAEEQRSFGAVHLNISSGMVKYHSKTVVLTKNELTLLNLLMEAEGQIVSREDMMNTLWQTDEFVDDNTLTVNMNRLRKTLAKVGLGDSITTRRGLGYQLREIER